MAVDCHEDQEYSRGSKGSKAGMLLGASFAFLGFFESKEEEGEKEPELITTLKRSVLLIQVRHWLKELRVKCV